MNLSITPQHERAIITVSGQDKEAFLQGLITNDIKELSLRQPIWTAFLSAQGKYIADFTVIAMSQDCWWLELPKNRLMEVGTKLRQYVIAQDVQLNFFYPRSMYTLFSVHEKVSENIAPLLIEKFKQYKPFIWHDVRHPALGIKLLFKDTDVTIKELTDIVKLDVAAYESWDRLRILNCVPDNEADLQIGKSIALEGNFDELGALSWDKGCYVGQEVTARTKYRGLIKKRLCSVYFIDGKQAALPQTPIYMADKAVGFLCSSAKDIALAMLRKEGWSVKKEEHHQTLTCNDRELALK